MNIYQRVRIPLEQAAVWHALNDPKILRQCMPGCETFERTADDTFEFKLTAKIGPVKAKFSGDLKLSEINSPNSYVINGEGKGGIAGFGKGSAAANLLAEGADTIIIYRVEARVGGKLAQIGSRLVRGAAKKMADEFFSEFVRVACGNASIEVKIESLDDKEFADQADIEN